MITVQSVTFLENTAVRTCPRADTQREIDIVKQRSDAPITLLGNSLHAMVAMDLEATDPVGEMVTEAN
jgi:hypothetical protein